VHRCRMEGISKAIIGDLIGSKDGLSSERRYVVKLAGSVLGYLLKGQIRRGLAVCMGLAITTLSYVKTRRARARLQPATTMMPESSMRSSQPL